MLWSETLEILFEWERDQEPFIWYDKVALKFIEKCEKNEYIVANCQYMVAYEIS